MVGAFDIWANGGSDIDKQHNLSIAHWVSALHLDSILSLSITMMHIMDVYTLILMAGGMFQL